MCWFNFIFFFAPLIQSIYILHFFTSSINYPEKQLYNNDFRIFNLFYNNPCLSFFSKQKKILNKCLLYHWSLAKNEQ